MFQKLLRLLGLGPKVDAIGVELDAMRDTMRDVNTALRKDLQLDGPRLRVAGGRRAAIAGK